MRRYNLFSVTIIFVFLSFAVRAQDQTSIPLKVIAVDNLDQLQLIKSIEFENQIFGVSFSNKTLAISGEKEISLFDINALDASPELLKPDDETVDIPTVVFSPDGSLLASSSIFLDGKGRVYIWNMSDNTIVTTLEEPVSAANLTFSPDGTKLAAADWTAIYIWDTTNWKLLSSFQTGDGPRSVAFSPDSTLLAAAFSTSLQVINIDTGETVNSYLNIYPTELSFSVNGYGVIFASVAEGVGVVDLEYSGESYLSKKWPLAMQPTDAFALSPDGSLVLTGDRGGQVKLWQIFPSEEFTVTSVADTSVFDVAFNPSGTMMAIVYSDHHIELWGVAE